MAKLGLDLSTVKVQQPSTGSFGIVPSGTYTVVVGSAEVKDTKNGSALVLGYYIIDGEYEGKMIKDFLNIVNPSEKTVQIAMERIATVSWATNIGGSKLENTEDLLNKTPFEIAVEQVDDGEYKNMKIKAVICTRDLSVTPPSEKVIKNTKPWATKK